jgi:hypothetical protein
VFNSAAFPSSGDFDVRVDNEVMEIVQDPSGITDPTVDGFGDYDIVSRALDGTQEVSHYSGAPVTLLGAATAPTLTAAANQTAVAGVSQAFNLGSFSDADGGPWTVAVSWGDSSANTTSTVSSAGALGTQTHTYGAAGNYAVTVTVTNSAGHSTSAGFEANVSAAAHTPPKVTPPNNQTAVEGVAQAVALGSFSDPDSGPWTVAVSWGDGSATTGFTTTTPGSLTQTHTFAAAGTLTVTVTITNSANQAASESFKVAVSPGKTPVPTVTGVGPEWGLTTGGTQVVISGTNLGTANTAKVYFGSNPGTIVSDNGSEIVVTSPPGAPGTVDVTVTTAGGTSATSAADQFIYAVPPHGAAQAANTVFFFTDPLTGKKCITFYDPPVAVGYDYQVTSGPNFAAVELPPGFTGCQLYLGNGQGGFQTTPYANLTGGVPLNLPAGVSSFRILGISSSANVNPTNSSAFATGLEFASQTPVTFDMTPIVTPTVTAIGPASGSTAGGTTVTITGTNLGTAATAAVRFGGKAATILSDNGTQITAVSPAGTGAVDVTVTTGGGTSVTSAADRFSYQPPTYTNWSAPANLGGTTGQTVVVRNSAGEEEMFVIGGDGAVWHKWQTSPNSGTWTGWYRLGGSAKQIAAAANAKGTLQVFFIGSDNAVWHVTENTNGTWNSPASLGGYAKQLTVGTDADGRLEIFFVGGDNAVWHQWQLTPNGNWSGQASLGGYAKTITVGQDADGRLEIFFVGGDNAVWHQWQLTPNGNWSGQFSLGGYAKTISVARNADGRLEVFFVGGDNAVWHQWQTSPNGNWSGQASLGGSVTQVALGQMANGALDVFGIDMSSDVWERHQM